MPTLFQGEFCFQMLCLSLLKSLEKSQYVEYVKEIINRKTYTKYSATIKGMNAFKKHIRAIEQLLK
jgi:hypothetical protein